MTSKAQVVKDLGGGKVHSIEAAKAVLRVVERRGGKGMKPKARKPRFLSRVIIPPIRFGGTPGPW